MTNHTTSCSSKAEAIQLVEYVIEALSGKVHFVNELELISILIAVQKWMGGRPRRSDIHTGLGFGEKLADRVASGMGSWKFIIVQTLFVLLWMTGNVYEIFHFDAFPFILLNLLFSTQAAYAAPIIMMAQNRQAAKDRQRDDRDDKEIGDLHSMQVSQMDSHKFQTEELKKQTIMLKQLLGRK